MNSNATPLERTPAAGEQAFESWVAPHLVHMRRLALRMAPSEHEDVFQDALLRAWKGFATYDPSRGSPRTWLLTIVANRARSLHALRRPAPSELPEGLVTEDIRSDTDLEAAVAGLARRQRTAVTLHYLLGLTVAEAAAVMGCSTGTVKSTLSDARSRLRTLLGEMS